VVRHVVEIKYIINYIHSNMQALPYVFIMVLNFGLFQLGGSLSLPWGLYMVICQVKSGEN
jgi:hypothetical protein